jgi:hypothetical protein
MLILGVFLTAFCIKDIYVFQQALLWLKKSIEIYQ